MVTAAAEVATPTRPLDERELLKAITEILDRGNTAEVVKRKYDVIVLESKKKIQYSSTKR